MAGVEARALQVVADRIVAFGVLGSDSCLLLVPLGPGIGCCVS